MAVTWAASIPEAAAPEVPQLRFRVKKIDVARPPSMNNQMMDLRSACDVAASGQWIVPRGGRLAVRLKHVGERNAGSAAGAREEVPARRQPLI